MIIGPFSGEPGYELLYWLPYLRHLGISQSDTAITRGGAGIWYPCETLDAYDLIGFEKYRSLFGLRYAVTKVQKSFGPADVLDVAILGRRPGQRGCQIIHPADMYQRLQDASDWPFEPLPKPDTEPDIEQPYIAAAFYTSYQMPPHKGAEAARLLTTLADRGNRIVALVPEQPIDDHGSIVWPTRENIEVVTFRPNESLKVQSQVIAHAEALICTYGGLSYLGPLYGVPTRAFHAREPNEIHAARENDMAAQLGASYERVRL